MILRQATAEAVGTFTLLFVGIGSIAATRGQDPLAIALAHGLAIALMVTALGRVSGGHFNPAVSFAFFLRRELTAGSLVVYWTAQVIGGFLGAGLISSLYPAALEMGTPAASAWGQAGVAEAFGTFFLVLVILSVVEQGLSFGGLAIGLTITMVALALGPISGASINPARWFCPAILQGHLTSAPVYLLAPLLGSVLAVGIRHALR
ncbi:MIP/aquaporin family protein [Thermus scotoductus]|uniref:MIP/aquaporin family protein n=2 Tax=Thermus scotoductus TaxID=37636 RepID=UPI001562A0BB|nr:aquaporin [Thermus scotoductus]